MRVMDSKRYHKALSSMDFHLPRGNIAHICGCGAGSGKEGVEWRRAESELRGTKRARQRAPLTHGRHARNARRRIPLRHLATPAPTSNACSEALTFQR